FRRRFRKHKSELCLIGCGFSVWRVVHFKDNVRTSFDQLAFAGMENFRRLAWRITDEKIAGQGARVRLLIRLCWRRDEKCAGLLILEVIGSGLAEVRDDVMHHRAVGRPHFEHLHPLVFLKAGGNEDVLVLPKTFSVPAAGVIEYQYVTVSTDG